MPDDARRETRKNESRDFRKKLSATSLASSLALPAAPSRRPPLPLVPLQVLNDRAGLGPALFKRKEEPRGNETCTPCHGIPWLCTRNLGHALNGGECRFISPHLLPASCLSKKFSIITFALLMARERQPSARASGCHLRDLFSFTLFSLLQVPRPMDLTVFISAFR